MEHDWKPQTPAMERELSLSQVVLVLAVTATVFCAAVAISNVAKPKVSDAGVVATRCARIAVGCAVVAVVCGVLQLRRRTSATPNPAAAGSGALRIRTVVVGCLGGIVAIGTLFSFFDRGEDGLIFIVLAILLLPVMLVWKARRFQWRW